MKQKNTILKNYRKRLRPGKTAEGFITVMMIPAFLTLLGFATAIAGSVSYSIQAMTHRNEMMQAYSLLEDDEVTWQDKALSAKWEELPNGKKCTKRIMKESYPRRKWDRTFYLLKKCAIKLRERHW